MHARGISLIYPFFRRCCRASSRILASRENRYRRQKADNTPSLALPYLNTLFFRMITATPQNHRTQENAICDPKHTPAYSKNDRPPTKKANLYLQNAKHHLPQNINTYYRNRMYDPKTPDMWAKTPPRRHKTKHVFYQNTTASSITYGFFRRNTLFSACIIEKRNTEYSTEHKIKAKNMNYADRSLHRAYRLRTVSDAPTQKKFNTPMPDRNNKITGFTGDTLQVFNLTPAAKNTEFSPQHSNKPEITQKKHHHHAAFSKTFLLLSPKSPAFSPQKNRPSMKHCETNKKS